MNHAELRAGDLVDPRALAQLKSLNLRVRRVVDGVLQGVHKSPHRGSSIEFADHKEYSPGDEIRHIDWKAYGRLDKYYVKRFEQETNLATWLVLDQSASMSYGADGTLTKFDYASVCAASLAYLLLSQQDALGMVTFSDGVQRVLPARSRLGHLNHLTESLARIQPGGTTHLSAGLQKLSDGARRRGLVLLFSDFFSPLDEAFLLLRQLVSQGHEVHAFHVLDGDELAFPFEEMTLFEGLESGTKLLAEPRLIRQTYLERMKEHLELVKSRATEARVELTLLDTRESPSLAILGVLRRLQASGGRR